MTRVIYNGEGEIVQVYEESEHSHDSLPTAEITASQVNEIDNYAVDPVKKVVYKKVEQPDVTQLQTVEDLGVKLVNGEYRQEWKVVDKFQDGKKGKTKKEQEEEYLAALKKDKYDWLRNSCHDEMQGMAQDAIDDYGSGVSDLMTCVLIAGKEDHDHYEFCKALLDWIIDLSDTITLVINQAEAGEILVSTVDDIIKLLPDFGYKKG